MLERVRPRLTYANVMVTIIAVAVLGGGAYAATGGISDSAGVLHGCVSNRTGVLRVVKSARSCQKARGRGRHRNPGEFAVSWNQRGPQGVQGIQGAQGIPGQTGAPGANGATHVVVRTAGLTDSMTSTSATASCDTSKGERATGGGVHSGSTNATAAVRDSYPTDGDETHPPTSWTLTEERVAGTGTVGGQVFVICAAP
jgi:hypothetical protein